MEKELLGDNKKINILLNNKIPSIEKENKYRKKIKINFEGIAYLSKDREENKETQIKSGHRINKNGKYNLRFISEKQIEYQIKISLKRRNYLLLILPFIIFIIIIQALNMSFKRSYGGKNINKDILFHIFYPKDTEEYIAQYCFEIATKGFKNTKFSNIRLADTINEKTLVDNLIAPGTSGSFDIIIKTKGGNLNVDYLVEVKEETTAPKNLVFFLKGDKKYYHSFSQFAQEKLIGNISKDSIKVLTVEWKWNYEESIENNKQDTIDGQTLKDYTFKIRAIGKNEEEKYEIKQ